MNNKLLEITKNTYNNISENWDTKRRYYWKPVINFLSVNKNKKTNLKLLDLGCGGGRHMELALDKGFLKENIFGCDYSKGQINIIKKKGFQAKVSNLLNLDYSDSSFDLIICIAAHHHLLDKDDQLKSLIEMKRLVSSSGKILLTNWFPDIEFIKNQVKKGKFEFLDKTKEKKNKFKGKIKVKYDVDGKKYDRYYYFFEEKELLDLCKQANLKLISKEYFKGNLYLELE